MTIWLETDHTNYSLLTVLTLSWLLFYHWYHTIKHQSLFQMHMLIEWE